MKFASDGSQGSSWLSPAGGDPAGPVPQYRGGPSRTGIRGDELWAAVSCWSKCGITARCARARPASLSRSWMAGRGPRPLSVDRSAEQLVFELDRRNTCKARGISASMTGGRSYGSPGAFRRALSGELRDLAARSRWTLQQLQRQMAYDRPLQRLHLLGEGWIIKSATALHTRDMEQRRPATGTSLSSWPSSAMVLSARPAAARARTGPASVSVSNAASSSGPAGARTARRS